MLQVSLYGLQDYVDPNSELKLLHRVAADDVVDVSVVHDASIFMVEMYRLVQS
jgi:hypothetical protein